MKSDKDESGGIFDWLQVRCREIDPGFVLNDDQLSSIRDYIDLFLAWNTRFSFSKFSTEKDIVGNLILPSFCHGSIIPQIGTLVDLGSGAGIPGAVISILRPVLNVTCIDSSESASQFLVEYQRKYPLKNLTILNGRADELAHDSDKRESFDIVVARAFAPMAVVLEIATGFVKPMGRIILQVPDKTITEIEHHKQDLETLSLENTRTWSLKIPPADRSVKMSTFCYCEFRKTRPSDDRFPRSWPALKKRPLWVSLTESD